MPLPSASALPAKYVVFQSPATIHPRPHNAQSRAIRFGASARSRQTKMLKRNAQAVLVYCRKMAAAAVVRVIAVTNKRFMPANVTTKGISMGRHRTCRGFTNNPSATPAASTRKQARIGPREPSGIAANGGLFTNAPLVLHKSDASATIIRPRRSAAACADVVGASEPADGSDSDADDGGSGAGSVIVCGEAKSIVANR